MLVRFLGVDIETGPDALRPREETELLGRVALAKLEAMSPKIATGKRRLFCVDVCCGTGNLACAIAADRDDATFVATDLTDGCVALARKNVARLGLASRVEVVQGDLFAAVPAQLYDLVTCNPPYISTGKLATRDDLADEPREAFDGGPYGVTIHQRVAREVQPLLRPGGWLVCELGLGQERQIELVFKRAGGFDTVEFHHDAAGAPRVVAARRGQS